VKGEHAVTFVVALNVPVAQAVHCRSAVVEPGELVEM